MQWQKGFKFGFKQLNIKIDLQFGNLFFDTLFELIIARDGQVERNPPCSFKAHFQTAFEPRPKFDMLLFLSWYYLTRLLLYHVFPKSGLTKCNSVVQFWLRWRLFKYLYATSKYYDPLCCLSVCICLIEKLAKRTNPHYYKKNLHIFQLNLSHIPMYPLVVCLYLFPLISLSSLFRCSSILFAYLSGSPEHHSYLLYLCFWINEMSFSLCAERDED